MYRQHQRHIHGQGYKTCDVIDRNAILCKRPCLISIQLGTNAHRFTVSTQLRRVLGNRLKSYCCPYHRSCNVLLCVLDSGEYILCQRCLGGQYTVARWRPVVCTTLPCHCQATWGSGKTRSSTTEPGRDTHKASDCKHHKHMANFCLNKVT